MNVFLNLKYRVRYIRRFIKCAKILGLPVSYRLLKVSYRGANPKIFSDSSEEYFFNQLLVDYLNKYQSIVRRKKEFVLPDFDLQVLAVNYYLLCETGLNILKYLPNMGCSSKRRLNEFLFALVSLLVRET